jgi:hypothetical protein
MAAGRARELPRPHSPYHPARPANPDDPADPPGGASTMAPTVVITCPECDKQITAPATLEGKKIRCKGCGNTFVVRTSAAEEEETAPPAKPAAKPKPAPQPAGPKAKEKIKAKSPSRPADDDDPNPYKVTDMDLRPRCPHCAGEMEEGDVICLHCGYNTQTRIRANTKVTIEHDFFDWFMHLLPVALCILVFIGMIGNIVFLLLFFTPIIEAHKEEWWNFGPRAMQLWGCIFSLAIMFFCARFVIKRLVWDLHPPENIQKVERREGQ